MKMPCVCAVHNIKSPLPVPPIKLQPAATGHIDGSLYNNDSFAVHLRREKGYNVGQFGKSNFNTCEGFSRWFQGAFLGYGGGWQDNEATNFSYHGKPNEYATALIGNKSVEWLHRPEITGAQSEGRPFFLCVPSSPSLVGVKSPNHTWTFSSWHAGTLHRTVHTRRRILRTGIATSAKVSPRREFLTYAALSARRRWRLRICRRIANFRLSGFACLR
jgi:hypothetical protein